jgi:hypothetical protein
LSKLVIRQPVIPSAIEEAQLLLPRTCDVVANIKALGLIKVWKVFSTNPQTSELAERRNGFLKKA